MKIIQFCGLTGRDLKKTFLKTKLNQPTKTNSNRHNYNKKTKTTKQKPNKKNPNNNPNPPSNWLHQNDNQTVCFAAAWIYSCLVM